MNSKILEISGLHFSYDQGKEVLHDLDFGVTQASSTGIVGSNGAGKTTLFQIICGISAPTQGTVKIEGNLVVPGVFNAAVGYVFQNPDDQLFCLSVLEDIMFGPLNMGKSFHEAKETSRILLNNMGLSDLEERPPHHLSFGEKRMVAIATVLSMQPDILILDEPTSNLDSRSRRLLIEYLQRIRITKLIASHDLEFILETCKEVALLHDGHIMEKGDSEPVLFNKDLMHSCHQEVPLSLYHKK